MAIDLRARDHGKRCGAYRPPMPCHLPPSNCVLRPPSIHVDALTTLLEFNLDAFPSPKVTNQSSRSVEHKFAEFVGHNYSSSKFAIPRLDSPTCHYIHSPRRCPTGRRKTPLARNNCRLALMPRFWLFCAVFSWSPVLTPSDIGSSNRFEGPVSCTTPPNGRPQCRSASRLPQRLRGGTRKLRVAAEGAAERLPREVFQIHVGSRSCCLRCNAAEFALLFTGRYSMLDC